MNCQAIQNKILALPDPRHIPDTLRDHVVGCAGCRVWAEQVARLEGLLEHLPTPPAPADKKSALIDELARGPIISKPFAVPAREPFASFWKRNAALVGALAAALLVAIGAWWAFTNKNDVKPEVVRTPKDPFLDKIVQRDVALAKADSAAKKLQILSGLADDLSAEARSLARVASPEELQELAKHYDRVVNQALLKRVEELAPLAIPLAELKAEFHALAGKLDETATETKKALGEVPPESKPALQRIVNVAEEGQKKLAKLALAKGV